VNERELRERLRATLPADSVGEDRAWQVVRRSYEPATAARARPRSRRTVVATASLVAVLAIFLVSVGILLRAGSLLRPATRGASAHPNLRSAPVKLPGGGELLVDSAGGPWIVHGNGSMRYLGRYAAAAWSPHSLFVVAWRGGEIAAVDLEGRVRWAVSEAGRVSVARWSPDGYRIAYIAGRALRVIDGDGTGEHLLLRAVRRVAPAWQPGAPAAHRLALIDAAGDIELRAADTGALLWRARPLAPVRQIAFSPDGRLLLAVSQHRLSLYDAAGRLLQTRTLPPGMTASQAAFSASGDRLALLLRQARPREDSVMLLNASAGGLSVATGRVLFSTPEPLSGLDWSPTGRWLLASSPAADQWIFIHAQAPTRLSALSEVAAHFRLGAERRSAAALLAGWQR
jgi:WD40 repeat protein